MSHSYFSSPRPRLFAHRGLALEAPENTIPAFLNALQAGADYIETDVRATSDGVAILVHDGIIDCGTMGSDSPGQRTEVRNLSLGELRRRDLGAGHVVPSLEEVLNEFPRARFNLDIKSADAVTPVVRAVRAAQADDRVLITSFSERRRSHALAGLRRLSPTPPTLATAASSAVMLRALVAHGIRSKVVFDRSVRGVDALQVPETYRGIPIVTPGFVDMAHNAGVEVHVWTVNDASDMQRLVGYGVDGIITDRVDIASKALRHVR